MTQYNESQAPQGARPAVNDSGSFGWAVLGFLIPIVGLVLFLVWKDYKPKSAKMAGWGALATVIIAVVGAIIGAIMGAFLPAGTYTFNG